MAVDAYGLLARIFWRKNNADQCGDSYSPLIAGAMRRSAQDGLFLGRPTNEDSVCFPVFFSLFMVFSVFFSLFMVFSVFDGFPIFCLSVSSNFPKLKFFKF
jgi:hypothetical protein